MRYRTWLEPEIPTTEQILAQGKEIENALKQNRDIFTEEKIETRKYNDDGTITLSYETKKTNISRAINESAKILKIDNAQKITELLKSLGVEE